MSRSLYGKAKLVLDDFRGLWHVCGLGVALRWLGGVLLHGRAASRSGNLQAVDRALGSGPFLITHEACRKRFTVEGDGIVSGIREMYARDCYLKGRTNLIRDGDVVVDLGANVGNFSNLALAHGEAVRVVAIEPSRLMNERFTRSVGGNAGFLERVVLIRGFLGEANAKQVKLLAEVEEYRSAPWLSESDFFSKAGIDRIDFLKCDIEGGEFAVLSPTSRFLDLATTVAVEIHAFAGPVDAVVNNLTSNGLAVLSRDDYPDGSCVVLASRGRS
jgi:FkbM family methyltransferase